jgi:hypothetical protein
MAKIVFGPVISEARNKIALTVYSRNRGGPYIREKVTPSQTPTTPRVASKNLMTSTSHAWSQTLTEAQRQAWRSFASTIPLHDKLGNTHNLSGQNWWQKLATNQSIIGAAITTDPPANLDVTQPATFAATATVASSSSISIPITPGETIQPGEHLQIWATHSMNLGRTYFTRLLRLIQTVDHTATIPIDAGAAWLTRYAPALASKRIGIALRYVNDANGNASKFQTQLITTTGGADMLLQAKLNLTSAQVLALNSIYQQIVAAPGAGYMLRALAASFTYHYGGTAYTVPGGTIIVINQPLFAQNAGVSCVGLLDQTADTTATSDQAQFTAARTSADNAPFVVAIGGGPVSAGNGTLTCVVDYCIDPCS